MIMTIPEVKLVLLVRGSRVERSHWVLMLHVWVHLIHFFAIHAGTVCSWHSALLSTTMRMPATHTSGTTWGIIWNTIGSRMIRDLVARMLRIIWHLAGVRSWMMHVWIWPTHHMLVTLVVFMRHAVVSMGHIVMTLHNRIWIVTMALVLLPVRTGVVHLAILILVHVTFTDGRSGLTPMTTI